MSSSHRRIATLAMTLLLCLPLAAQNGTVYGIVNDAEGKPAPGIQVALDNPEIGFHQRTISASDGGFRFREVPPASGYWVTAIVKQEVVSPRLISLNVDDQKEVWPELRLPPTDSTTEVVDAGDGLSGAAAIYGLVVDSAGKPMIGAEVRLENESKGYSKTLVVDAEGRYRFEAVPPGRGYRLIASQRGKVFSAKYAVELQPNIDKNILPPLSLPPEKALALEAVSTAVGGVITGEQLRALPLYNRNFLALGLLTPQTHDAEPGSELAGASFSVSGARPSSNNFLLDGTDNVASSSGQAVPFQVNDSIQEFRVIASNASAEYGRNLGGVVSVLTRRGTRTLHGSAYGYFANDAFNADGPLSIYNGTTFDKAAGFAGAPAVSGLGTAPPPANQGAHFPFRYNDYVNIARNSGYCTDSIVGPLLNPSNCVAAGAGANRFFDPAAVRGARDQFKYPFDSKQFGASVGGAIKGERLFAFASYEGTRINNPNPIFERVPTKFDKAYNPLNAPTSVSSTPVRTMFSPNSPDYLLAQSVFALFPAPNVVGVPGVLEFFQGEAPNYTHVHNVLLRADWSKSERTTFSTRYVAQILRQLHDSSLPAPTTAGGYPGNGAFRGALNQNLSLVMKRSFRSSMINETRFGISRFNVRETAQDAGFDARTLGVAGSGFPNASLPTILLNGLDPRYSGAYLGVDGAVGGWSEVTPSFALCPGPPTCVVPLPRIAPTLDGLFPLARLGAPLNAPTSRVDTTYAISNHLTFTHGRHDMKAGFSVRILTNQVRNGAYQRGFVYSANLGEFGHDSETCNAICTSRVFAAPANAPPNAFLRPSFDFARIDDAPLAGDFRSWAPAFFFQDSWRIHPRVTLNLGLRYEYSSPPRERSGQTWNFDPTAGGLIPNAGTPTTVDPYGNLCGSKPLDKSTPEGGNRFAPPLLPWSTCTAVGNATAVAKNARDFAARLGVAWDVYGDGKTVMRVGVGTFWDQLPVNYMSQLIFNRPTTKSNAIYGQLIDPKTCFAAIVPFAAGCGLGNSMINPARRSQTDLSLGLTDLNGNPFANSYFSEATFPFAMYARDTEHSSTPLALQTNLTMQHQFPFSDHFTLELGYVGTIARRLPVIFNSRAATEFKDDSTGVQRPPIETFPVFTMTNQGSSDYHSLVARVRAAQWRGLRMNSTYVYSRSLDNGSSSLSSAAPITLQALALQDIVRTGNLGAACFLPNFIKSPVCGATLTLPNIIDFRSAALTTTGAAPILVTPYSFPQDPFNFLADERGRSDFDVTHRLVVDYTWEVPAIARGPRWSKWTDRWILSGIFVAQSGQPFTIFSVPAAAVELTQRVNLVGSGPTFNFKDPKAAISTTSSNGVVAPLPGCNNAYLLSSTTACIGDSPRNGFTGPGFINLDFAAQKGFLIQGENKMLTFRAEVYNFFNRDNYYNPITRYSTDGVNPNPEFGQIKSAHEPRRVQFAVRFNW